MKKTYNLIIIGSGVGCCCFLKNFIKYNKNFNKNFKILIIEKGKRYIYKKSILYKNFIYNNDIKLISNNNEPDIEGGFSAFHDKGQIYYNKFYNIILDNLNINTENENIMYTLCKLNNNKTYEINRLFYNFQDILKKYNNINIIYESEVNNIIINNDKAIGVNIIQNNIYTELYSNDIILSSGTLNTFKIIKKTIFKYNHLDYINNNLGKGIFFNRNLLFIKINTNIHNYKSIDFNKKYTFQKILQLISNQYIYKNDFLLNLIKYKLKYILIFLIIFFIIIILKIKNYFIKKILYFIISILIFLLIIIINIDYINFYMVIKKEKINFNNQLLYNNNYNNIYIYHKHYNINKKFINNIEKKYNCFYINENKALSYLQGGLKKNVNKYGKLNNINNLYICDSSILKPSIYNPIGQLYIKSYFIAKKFIPSI